MRIAVCFSGQIRTGVESSSNLLNFIGDLLPYTDFFIHTWDIETKKNYNAARVISRNSFLKEETVSKIIEIYNPKKIVIENWNDLLQKDEGSVNGIKILSQIPPLWYSFTKSVELKLEYENEMNFEYDYVIKLRPDIIFPQNRNLKKEIEFGDFKNTNNVYIENRQTIVDMNTHHIDDVYFISSSKNMNIASKYYYGLYDVINKSNIHMGWPFQYGFAPYLLKNNLNVIENHKYADSYQKIYKYSIYREECLNFSPNEDFEKCWVCDDYYFGATQNKSHSGKFYVEDLKLTHEVEDNIEDINAGKFYYLDELKKRDI
jgi:hypothetical protein